MREREISSLFFPPFSSLSFFWPFSLSLLSYYTTHYQNTNHTYIHTSIQTPTTPTLTPFFLFPPQKQVSSTKASTRSTNTTTRDHGESCLLPPSPSPPPNNHSYIYPLIHSFIAPNHHPNTFLPHTHTYIHRY